MDTMSQLRSLQAIGEILDDVDRLNNKDKENK